jgi:hypothetical protein
MFYQAFLKKITEKIERNMTCEVDNYLYCFIIKVQQNFNFFSAITVLQYTIKTLQAACGLIIFQTTKKDLPPFEEVPKEGVD